MHDLLPNKQTSLPSADIYLRHCATITVRSRRHVAQTNNSSDVTRSGGEMVTEYNPTVSRDVHGSEDPQTSTDGHSEVCFVFVQRWRCSSVLREAADTLMRTRRKSPCINIHSIVPTISFELLSCQFSQVKTRCHRSELNPSRLPIRPARNLATINVNRRSSGPSWTAPSTL